MPIDLLLKLIDRTIQLINQQKTESRDLLKDFVDPVQKSFEELHASYAASFIRYRHELLEGSGSLTVDHPIFAQIAVDAMYEGVALRDRLRTFYEGMRKPASGNQSIQHFAVAVHEYLTLGIDFENCSDPLEKPETLLEIERRRNIPRTLLQDDLHQLISTVPELPREKACEVLDGIFMRLENRHAVVFWAYQRVRNELLK